MIKRKDVPSDLQLIELSEAIKDIMKDIRLDNMYITFEYPKQLLKKVNENFYSKTIEEGNEFVDGDVVIVDVVGVKYHFIKKDGEEEE